MSSWLRGPASHVTWLVVSLLWVSGGSPLVAADPASGPSGTASHTEATQPVEGAAGGAGEAQKRGLTRIAQGPPYWCNAQAGVCMCLGAANCDRMTQPIPCKRQKMCTGQPVPQRQPLPPGQQVPQSMARTTETNLVICSCRSGP
jgi:hypothetical protein